MRHLLLALLALIATSLAAADSLVDRALAGDAAAIAELRAAGPAGLHRVLAVASDGPAWYRAIDAVAGQLHAHQSRLYWYTDLEQAKAAAQASGKPIVSLRLLGKLTDELSCANSRFFRVLLYADPQVSAWLRERAVLHWSTERAAPVMTIDFGDGRTVRTTITGNSAHYLLDGQGRPLDCIPGLYGPQGFLAALEQGEALHRSLAGKDGNERLGILTSWHQQRADALLAQRTAMGLPDAVEPDLLRDAVPAEEPTVLAMSKAAVEIRPVRALVNAQPKLDPIDWAAVGAQGRRQGLSLASMALIRGDIGEGAADLRTVLDRLSADVATDTARNELDLHLRIHRRFVGPPMKTFNQVEFAELNAWVYGAVFLTPASDPWLGLDPRLAYAALPGNGIVR